MCVLCERLFRLVEVGAITHFSAAKGKGEKKMASSSSPPSGNSSGASSSSSSSSGQAHSYAGKRDASSKQKFVSVRIQPTIGPSFTLSLSTGTKISTFKESISDKMGLSPHKMTLLLHNK